MKRSTVVYLIFAAALMLGGIGCFLGGMIALDFDFTWLSDEESVRTEIVPDTPFTSIAIDVDTTDITFALAEDGICRVVCEETDLRYHRATVQNGTLQIYAEDRMKWYDYCLPMHLSLRVTVYLPLETYDSLRITTDTGDVFLRGAVFDSVAVETDTGRVTGAVIADKWLNIETDTGNIQLDSITTSAISLVTDTGEIELDKTRSRSMYIETDTGRVRLLDAVVSDVLQICSDTGDVLLEKCDAQTIRIETDTGDICGSLLTEKVFLVETDTGEIDIPNTSSGGRCELTTATGDIPITIAK